MLFTTLSILLLSLLSAWAIARYGRTQVNKSCQFAVQLSGGDVEDWNRFYKKHETTIDAISYDTKCSMLRAGYRRQEIGPFAQLRACAMTAYRSGMKPPVTGSEFNAFIDYCLQSRSSGLQPGSVPVALAQ